MDATLITAIVLLLIGGIGLFYCWWSDKTLRALKRGIADCKAGRTRRWSASSFDKWCKEEKKWEKAHPVQCAFRDAFYAVRRVFYSIPDMPRDAYNEVKYAYQRVRYGWCTRDTWAFDHHLSKVIVGGVKHLRNNITGVPRVDDTGDDEKDYDIKKWEAILDEIIWAFDLNEQIANGYRENYWPEKPAKYAKDKSYLTLKEDIRRRRGMLLFLQYYFLLVD